ncbi:MAG: lamin tail domain-containing protein, partial [Candidatus Shapirobacteria bacterium]
ANPDTDQNEWIEIYNPSDESIFLKDLCFYDASQHSRCFTDTDTISPKSYFSHSFSSGFLNNDGDTVNFLDTSIIYPKSPKNFTYSRQENNSWCFSTPSQNMTNIDCTSVMTTTNSTEEKYSPPNLTLQFIPDSVNAGDDFNLVFSLNSADQYFLRVIYPFGSQYFPFTDYHDGYSWLTMPLSTSKKLPTGLYPLSFHLKKNGSSHLYDYQLGEIKVVGTDPSVRSSSITKQKILGVVATPQPLNCPPQISTIKPVLPDLVFFSWPFLFAGSILFLSPILFPKLYAA